MPDAGILATVMLLVGLFLLGLEFFIPSFGMILVVAVLSLLVSFWSAWKAWWGISPWFFWTYVLMLLAGIPGSLMAAIALIQKTSFGNRMILKPGPPVAPPVNPLSELIGKRAQAQTLMTPGGIVLLEGQRHHAESIGMLIESGVQVIVVAVRGNRVVVRPTTVADSEAVAQLEVVDRQELAELIVAGRPESRSVPEELPSESVQEPNPLDFDIPEDYTRKS